MDRTGGVRQRTLRVLALFLNSFQRCLKVARVVHCVEHTENVYAIGSRTLYKLFNHVISVMTVAKQVLTTQQHLVLGLWHCFLEFADTIPWIFTEEADAGVKCCAAPGLK